MLISVPGINDSARYHRETLDSIPGLKVIAEWDCSMNSYAGEQTLPNINLSPATGDGQTTWDMQLGATTGASTDDPTHEYGRLVYDGDDYVRMKNTTTLLTDSVRSSNPDYTIFLYWYDPGQAGTNMFIDAFYTDAGVNTETRWAFRRITNNTTLEFTCTNNGSKTRTTLGSHINVGEVNFMIATISPANGRLKYWFNDDVAFTTLNGAFTVDATENSYANLISIAGLPSAGNSWDNGTMLYAAGVILGEPTTTQVEAIKTILAARNHGPTPVAPSGGTKMYVVSSQFDGVYQYSLSTAWDLSTVSYDEVSFSISGQGNNPTWITFKPDGTKFYTVTLGTDSINEYSLSTAWDVSTASFVSSKSVNAQDAVPRTMEWNNDGTKMYMVGNDENIYIYTASTPYDLSTVTYDSNFEAIASLVNIFGMRFGDSGNKMYLVDFTDTMFQYSLSTPYDPTTQTYDSKSYSFTTETSALQAFDFNFDGTKVFILDSTNQYVRQYSLSTAWDISTASYDTVFIDVSTEDNTPLGIVFDRA